jgi:hypothetical protein
MCNFGLFTYRPKDQMSRSSVAAPISYKTGTGINEDELNRCIQNLLNDRPRDKANGIVTVRNSDKRLYSYISDIVKYAITHNLKLHTKTIIGCLNANAFTLSDAMIDQLLENQPSQEDILLQLLKDAQDCDQIKAILDYTRKKGIKLFEYAGFIYFLENKVSEMVESARWIPNVGERALLLVYAIDNMPNIPYLNNNLQPIIKYLVEYPFDHSDCIKSLLKYASEKKLQLEVMSLLDESVKNSKYNFIHIYRYALAHKVIDHEAQIRFFDEHIEKHFDKYWVVVNVLEKTKVLEIPIDVLKLVKKQITEKKDDGLFVYLNYLNNADYVALEQLLLDEIKNNGPCVTILLSHYVNSKRKLQNENFIPDVLNENLEHIDSEKERNTRALLDYCLANDLEIKNQEHLPERLQYCIKNKYYSLCAPILKYMGQYKVKIPYKASMESDQRNPISPNFVDIFDRFFDDGEFRTDQLMIYAKQAEILLEVNKIVDKLDGYCINFLIDYTDSQNISLDLTNNLVRRIANGDKYIEDTLDLVGGLVTFNANACLEKAIDSDNPEALGSIIKYLASIDKIVNIDVDRLISGKKTKCLIKYWDPEMREYDLSEHLVEECIRHQVKQYNHSPDVTNKFFKYASERKMIINKELVKTYHDKVANCPLLSNGEKRMLLFPCEDYAKEMKIDLNLRQDRK